MNDSADFRSKARGALQGKWGLAVLVGLVATLLGGVASGGPEVELNIDLSNARIGLSVAGQNVASMMDGVHSELGAFIGGGMMYIIVAALVMAAVHVVLGSIVEVGYARFNLGLVDGKDVSFETLFSCFSNWKTTTIARLLQGLYVFLWGLLFIIPGIVAAYSYAMTGYILAENPEMTASEAIAKSKEMMSGNRWRLFCLQFSFIGWTILCAFTLGIGNLWLTPYEQAAIAAFYRDVSGTEYLTVASVTEEVGKAGTTEGDVQI